jgi:hypothetical protein
LKLIIHQRKSAEFFTNYCCAKVLHASFDCKIVTYPKLENPLMRILLSTFLATRAVGQIIGGRKLVYQFPPKIEVIPAILLAQAFGRRPIAIVHDLDYLRNIRNHGLLFILDSHGHRMLRHSTVIVHKGRMADVLKEQNIFPKSYIQYWPHLLEKKPKMEDSSRQFVEVEPVLLYAGNLNLKKCQFVESLDYLNRKITLYGTANFEIKSKNISLFPPFMDATPPKISAPTLGLIWDGDSIDGLQGTYGEYQKINLPAKLSLYLAIGIPVVVSIESNMVEFVRHKGIGICVQSLQQIPITFSSEEWRFYVGNVQRLSQEMFKGSDLIAAFRSLDTI